MENGKKYQLVTRSDFDGLACALLLMHKGIINDVLFVHPKDVQDGKVKITSDHITTNLPYVEGVHLAFDHHLSEEIRVKGKRENHIIDVKAPSAARVVYNYYGGKKAFPDISQDFLRAADKIDSARLSKRDVLYPKGWVMLGFIMDPRTGFGRFKNFRISNYQLMMDLIIQAGLFTIEQILEHPDIKERVELYKSHRKLAKKQLLRVTKQYKNLIVIDLRNEDPIYVTNRFMPYILFPEANISIHVMWGKDKKFVTFAVGKSIFNKTSKTNIGELMLKYNGGGHLNAGTCQIDVNDADRVLQELIDKITKDG